MKAVCLHGHFYQPPRENAWLEAVEHQDSAYPYHDWNARITAECYGPNTASRLLDHDGRIMGITNNFSRISFNVGPTLMSWLEKNEPSVYTSIIEADRLGAEHYGGHGTAIAQAYNHIIMPLANSRDKRTQVRWGVADFEHRFGRKPEGMWLAETAVDLETLECLVEEGIRYTILAPRQASEVRQDGADQWYNVSGGHIDPRRPYRCELPSGRSIAIFFYDGPIAQDIAFAGLLKNGDAFAHRLLQAFDQESTDSQIVHVATDGETYGHHHQRGEMALAYALYHLEERADTELTVYGEFLELHPPTWEARIHENSSWSCVHGVERWKSDCGCNSGMHGGWHQQWRAPLREALDWLRDESICLYEKVGTQTFYDPWVARDDYINVLLNTDEQTRIDFLHRHLREHSHTATQQTALMLLEMQRCAMLMYTSCGWFFDEVSGIETTQIMQYAARVIQLARALGEGDLEVGFLEKLALAPSNLPEHENAAAVYMKYVKPAEIDLRRLAAHAALVGLFSGHETAGSLYSYHVDVKEEYRLTAGRQRLILGVLTVRSIHTLEAKRFHHAVLHLGDHNIYGGIAEVTAQSSFDEARDAIRAAFESAAVSEVILAIDRYFPDQRINLSDVFHDEQRAIVKAITQEAEGSLNVFMGNFFRDNYQLMIAMGHLGAGLPRVFRHNIEYVVNRELLDCLAAEELDLDRLNHLIEIVMRWKVKLHRDEHLYAGSERIEALVQQLEGDPLSTKLMEQISTLIKKYHLLDIPLNLWYSQNAVYMIGRQHYFIRQNLASHGDKRAVTWVSHFEELAEQMGVRVQ